MSLGLDPELFWDVTPREGAAIADGAVARLRREHNGRAWLALNTAILGKYDPRKLPKLGSLTVPVFGTPPRRQSSSEQLMMVKTIAAVLGATTKKPRKNEAKPGG